MRTEALRKVDQMGRSLAGARVGKNYEGHKQLQCTTENHDKFATKYQYNMNTAPPTGAGVYDGPLDSILVNKKTFSWLYMPLLLNALPQTILGPKVFFAKFLTAMPRQYSWLICYYKRVFVDTKVDYTHTAASPDGPLHFSGKNQETLMDLAIAPLDGSVKPRVYCEFLATLVLQSKRHVIPSAEYCTTIDMQMQMFFPNTLGGFPFPMCTSSQCAICDITRKDNPKSPPSISVGEEPPLLTIPTTLLPVNMITSPVAPANPNRRIHKWERNSCYVDAALQTWFHILQTASTHFKYPLTANNFIISSENIPRPLRLSFFPEQLQASLFDWLQCKLELISAETSEEVLTIIIPVRPATCLFSNIGSENCLIISNWHWFLNPLPPHTLPPPPY
jgi:hypothetical protein